MKQGITVSTWSGGQESCKLLLKSLWNIQYPVLVVVNDHPNMPVDWHKNLYYLTGEQNWHMYEQPYDGYEIGAIEATLTATDWEEFILLQDTIEIKNQKIFEILFENYQGRSVAYNPYFQMYLGKYRREVLERMTLPEVRTKADAVRQEEIWTRAYMQMDQTDVFNPQFKDEAFYENWEDMFGRVNLKMEDEYIIKRKGTWSASQL